MRFWGSKDAVNIRDARLDDSESLSLLQWEYLQRYSLFDIPRTPQKFRNAIGNSLLRGDRFLVAEDGSHEVIGFVEQKKQNINSVKIGFPYVSLHYPNGKDIQFHLVNQTLHSLKEIGTTYVCTEFSDNIKETEELFSILGFSNTKVIFQNWEGNIEPKDDIELHPFEIRRIKRKDLDITYSWIYKQLDPDSPLYISKSTYKNLLRETKSLRDGWAIATLDDEPVGMISSIKDPSANIIVIFGPYAREGMESVRIPLINELFLHHRLRGYTSARILRINIMDNDEKLLKTFNFKKVEEIKFMSKDLS